jgi:hypothetical protein
LPEVGASPAIGTQVQTDFDIQVFRKELLETAVRLAFVLPELILQPLFAY